MEDSDLDPGAETVYPDQEKFENRIQVKTMDPTGSHSEALVYSLGNESEVRIYKRKQENKKRKGNKNSTNKVIKNFFLFFLGRFLGRVLVFFYKSPPQVFWISKLGGAKI